MEQQTNLQKNIGIFLGCIVACGVLAVTIIGDNQSTAPITASINQTNTNPNTTVQNPASTNAGTTQNTTPAPKTIPTQTPTTTPVVTQTPPVDVPKKNASVYADGTYSATGSYMSPGGYEQLGVSITLKNDIITSASVTNMAGDGRSQRYQNMFISGYQQYVVGKNIADVYLTKVSGSSLTPSGFNDALAQIKSQAKA
jgi:uncharacterized protein with FMN-binding domain